MRTAVSLDDELLAKARAYVGLSETPALLLAPGVRLWSADRRLVEAVGRCGLPVFAP